jgi:cell division protease FtsH
MNEAALAAARQGGPAIGERELTDVLEQIQLGTARNVVMPAAARRRSDLRRTGGEQLSRR